MDPQRTNLYLLGVGVTHSIAPPMHNHVGQSLSLPWKFTNLECPTVEDMVKVLNSPTTAGAVITMPYKQSVIPHLSGGVDEASRNIGAVNNVYLTSSDPPRLRGTNTDYIGVVGCLRSADRNDGGSGRPALVVGAGGASRAAVYALSNDFNVKTVYVINRDEGEVQALQTDVAAYGKDKGVSVVHVTSVSQAESLAAPFYVVGTVPDIEPKSDAELEMRRMLEILMGKEKGVLLDMCFKPRNTRTMKLGRRLGWACVDGTNVIGYQAEKQWKLWTGRTLDEEAKAGAWKVLNDAAENSTAINF